MRHRQIQFYLVAPLCCVISGCSIGPQVKTEYVIVEPGKPVEILQNTGKLKCRQLEQGGQPVFQDVGGWVAMPDSHWQEVKKILQEKKPDIKPTP